MVARPDRQLCRNLANPQEPVTTGHTGPYHAPLPNRLHPRGRLAPSGRRGGGETSVRQIWAGTAAGIAVDYGGRVRQKGARTEGRQTEIALRSEHHRRARAISAHVRNLDFRGLAGYRAVRAFAIGLPTRRSG